jgi:hypothetical protein
MKHISKYLLSTALLLGGFHLIAQTQQQAATPAVVNHTPTPASASTNGKTENVKQANTQNLTRYNQAKTNAHTKSSGAALNAQPINGNSKKAVGYKPNVAGGNSAPVNAQPVGR